MSETIQPVFKIVPTTQSYDWGKIGRSSKVAELALASGIEIQTEKPYAELWMGTHPSSPSHALHAGAKTRLSDLLAAHPELIGPEIAQRFPSASEGNLPFLLKVLSIQKALSIQTHPDKATAAVLHAQQPNVYKDANHKPEMALALTPFEALCGFRPLSEIAANLGVDPELTTLLPSSVVSEFLIVAFGPSSDDGTPTSVQKAALKSLFEALMTAAPATVVSNLADLVERYRGTPSTMTQSQDPQVVDLVLRLSDQFPGDVGVFCALLLNYVRLQPGQAIFLGAGEPHAYISGDIIECMANSDNVIRAGLTPKPRDVPNLVSGLTYEASIPDKHVVNPETAPFASGKAHSVLYDPPIPEFSVVEVKLTSEIKTEKHQGLRGPSVAIVTDGQGFVRWSVGQTKGSVNVAAGDVVFIGAGAELVYETDKGLVVYRAFVEVK